MKSVKIYNESNPSFKIHAGLCNTFFTRLMGFMFKVELNPYFGLFFPGNTDSRVDSSIHMLFVNFNLSVFWLDSNTIIVDKVLAKKWHPLYVPHIKSRHILELHEARFKDLSVGDKLIINYED